MLFGQRAIHPASVVDWVRKVNTTTVVDFHARRSLLLATATGFVLPTGLAPAQAGSQKALNLDLQRAGQRLRLNLLTAEGYQAAAWMLRDIQAGNRVGWPSPELLAFAAHLQRALTEHHAYTVFTVTSGLRTHTTDRKSVV